MMTKLAYLECPTGLAGDMCLGALVHAGVPLEYLDDMLRRLGISDEYRLWSEQVHRNGQQATKVHVELTAGGTAADSFSTDLDRVDRDRHPTFSRFSHPTKSSEWQHETAPQADSKLENPPHGEHSHHHHLHVDHSHHQHSGDPRFSAEAIAQSPKHAHRSGDHSHTHTRHLPEIEQMIQAAGLPPRAAAWSLAVFRRLAEAEGAVHGIAPEEVHFHEVGATDAIVDIVGTCLGLDWLGIDELYCSALPVGGGTVWAAHGRLPVPSPAVLKLWELRQVPIYSNGIERELVTPTGAAIATALAVEFGTPPPMTLRQVGLGAGSRDLAIPNILRLWIGETSRSHSTNYAAKYATRQEAGKTVTTASPQTGSASPSATPSHLPSHLEDTIAVLETQIDDLNPQAIGYVQQELFSIGALDVFTQPLSMKKSRPGILLTVICHLDRIDQCEAVMFRETTTLGIRRTIQQRTILHRDIQVISTPYGAVRVKVARKSADGEILNVQPEYEDCAQLAKDFNLPWREVHRQALNDWYQQAALTALEASNDS